MVAAVSLTAAVELVVIDEREPQLLQAGKELDLSKRRQFKSHTTL